MLSDIYCGQRNDALCAPKPDDRYSRSQREDMKEAMDLLFKFKEGLDKLHPECVRLIEKLLQHPNPRNY